MSEKEFIIRKPDDWHLHLRDGDFGQLDFLSRMLLYSRSMELQLKSGVLLNDALVQAEHLFSGSQQKN